MSEKNITPYYQSGVAGVEHRNLDAAGEGHPFGNEPKEFTADLRPLIRQVADDLYESWEATIREYLANAETACLKVEQHINNPEQSPFDDMIVGDSYQPTIQVTWDRSENKVIIKDNGIGMAAVEVDEVFRHIGRSAARDIGTMSGSFGMGALSFFKTVGADSSMVMTSHSRLNDDNASYLVSLAGVEPVMGQMSEDEYGTEFKLTQKNDDMDVRQAVERFGQWMRTPVLYRELDENKEEVYNDDLGDKRLYDEYDEDDYIDDFIIDGCFEAYTSWDATGKTLLLSMEIDRNDSGTYGSTWPFDVRLLDESGKVVRSSNGNEGLVPISRMEYEQILKQERDEYITRDKLGQHDVVACPVIDGPNEGSVLIEHDVLESGAPLPHNDYVTDVRSEDRTGDEFVIIGEHKGRKIVTDEEWNSLPEGRASMYVPEDTLEPYNTSSGEGDLTLPKPTTDRSSLQSHDTFWKFIGDRFGEKTDRLIDEYREAMRSSTDQMEALLQMEDNTVKAYKENQ